MKKTGSLQRKPTARDRQAFFLSALFVCGVAAGVVSLRFLPSAFLDELLALGEGLMQKKSFSEYAAAMFASLFLCLAVLFFCGFSAIGQPLASLTLVCRGIACGALSGVLYAKHSVGYFGLCALNVQLEALLAAPILILACRESFIFSGKLYASSFIRSDAVKPLILAKYYYVKFIAFTGASIILSAFVALLKVLFLTA